MENKTDKKQRVIDFAKKIHIKNEFNYHILPVVNNSILLAKKLKANEEVVEISAYLHDITNSMKREDVKEYVLKNDHHITGAKEAVRILREIGYDEEFIKKVEHCVLAHRGRSNIEPETKEAEIVACADAMSHFDTFLELVPLFSRTAGSFEAGIIKLDEKIERDWNKKLRIPETKEIVKEKYKAIKLLLNSMKEYIKED